MLQVMTSAEGSLVPVLVQPGAGGDRICGEHDGRLKVAVGAPPERGKANKAVIKLLADRLGVSKSQISIRSGQHSRRKEVFIERVAPDALEAIIG
jgi:hypothetical protein